MAAPGAWSASRAGPRMVIAIDYGTTFTGLAWVDVKHEQAVKLADVNVFTEWPRLNSTKVPSAVSFSLSEEGREQWGHDIEPGSNVLRWTKLELQPRGRLAALNHLNAVAKGLHVMAAFQADEHAGANASVPEHLSLSSEGLILHLLREIAQKFCHELRAQNSVIFDTSPIDLVISHPGVWPYEARNKTVRAVRGAFTEALFPKLRHISLCDEPEASALYTSMTASAKNRARLFPGNCFLLLDAGGGTVDLVAYELRSRSPFEIIPLTKPASLHCGATAIDRQFFKWLSGIIGNIDVDIAGVGVGGHYILGPIAETVLNKFIQIKHAFDEQDTDIISLPRACQVLNNPLANSRVVNHDLRLTREDLEEIFAPAVTEITDSLGRHTILPMVNGMRRNITHIFMTGGFSENPYLFRKVKEWAKMRRMQVERGDDTWGAVVRGAVLKGAGVGSPLPPISTTCRRHYGIVVEQYYAEHLDHENATPRVDRLTGNTMARKQIRWHFKKGDLISFVPGEMSRDVPLITAYTETELQRGMKCKVLFVASDQDEPPTQLPDSPEGEETINLVCEFRDIPKSERTTLQRANSIFRKYYKTTIWVNITVQERVYMRLTAGSTVLATADTSL